MQYTQCLLSQLAQKRMAKTALIRGQMETIVEKCCSADKTIEFGTSRGETCASKQASSSNSLRSPRLSGSFVSLPYFNLSVPTVRLVSLERQLSICTAFNTISDIRLNALHGIG